MIFNICTALFCVGLSTFCAEQEITYRDEISQDFGFKWCHLLLHGGPLAVLDLRLVQSLLPRRRRSQALHHGRVQRVVPWALLEGQRLLLLVQPRGQARCICGAAAGRQRGGVSRGRSGGCSCSSAD